MIKITGMFPSSYARKENASDLLLVPEFGTAMVFCLKDA